MPTEEVTPFGEVTLVIRVSKLRKRHVSDFLVAFQHVAVLVVFELTDCFHVLKVLNSWMRQDGL